MIVLDVTDGRADAPANPFSTWLLEAMDQRGVKNNQLAALMTARGLKVSRSMISTYRYGTLPDRDTSDKLAAFFEADAEMVWLLVREARRLREEQEDALRRGRHVPGLGPEGDVTSERPGVLVVSAPAVGETRIDDPRLVGYFYGFLSKWARMTEEERESLLADEADIPEPPAAGGDGDAGGGGAGAGGAR
jgi:hypothetical protein